MERDFTDMFNYFMVSNVTKAYTEVIETARTYHMETNFIEEKK